MVLETPENRFSRIHLTMPDSVTGGAASGSIVSRTKAIECWCVSDISTLLQLNTVVVDVHHGRNGEADRQIEQHQQQDRLNRPARLVQGDATKRARNIHVAHGNGE